MSGIDLFPFQRQCVNEIEWFEGRCLLALDMGLGKTRIALQYIAQHPETLPAVIVCPASVKYHWQHECLSTTSLRATVLEGQTPSESTPLARRPSLVVLNFDILRHWLPWLQQMKPRTVVVDESQYAANPNAKRTRALRALCKGVPHLLALSGTPLVNRPIELQPVLQLVRPDLFPSRWDYAHRYCAPKWTPWGWQYKGASNLPELHEVLSREVMVRRLKTDVLKELPPKTRSVIPVPLSDANEYRRADLDFAAWLTRQDPAAARRALKAETLTKIGYLLRLAARLKLPFVVEWINEWLGDCDEKLVVFAVHRQMIEALREGCKARSVVVDGGVTGRRRHDVVRAFQNDGGIRLLIGNIQAAGVGITLTAASTVAFAEMAWRPGDHTQAEDRCHRIGTTEPVFVHYLVAHDTVEEKLCKLVQQKQEILSATLDGKMGAGDLDVYGLLLKELKRNAQTGG